MPPAASDSGPPARLTTALGRSYRVERELGQGGMATVYLAHDLKHDRDVAIKVLHPDLGAALGAERFLSEIKTTARLQHPHILPLLDSGEADGLLFYVMPLVTGETLRQRLDRERQLPVDDAVLIARDVADALGYAHGLGVIHRDIKPENILLQGGHALVADFGIALAVQQAGGARMTQTGLSLGTPQYMSPEQAMGERTIDARSDIYALGAVTYEMLTGDPPFTGSTVQAIVAKVMTERPTRPSTVRDTITPNVEAAVLKALAKLPADRFGSAEAFAAALIARDGVGGSSGALPALMAHGNGWRARLDWRIAAALGVLLGGAVTAGLYPKVRGADAVSADWARTQVTFDGVAGAPAISPRGDLLAYVKAPCDQSGKVGFLEPDLEEDNTIPCHASLIVQDSATTAPVTLLADVPYIRSTRFTHDGASVVFQGRLDSLREGTFVIPRLGGVARQIGAIGIFDTHASGDSVVFIAGTHRRPKSSYARILRVSNGTVVDSIPMPSRLIDAVAWSPDGRFFAVSVTNSAIMIVGRDGTVIDSIPSSRRSSLRWAPSGDGLLMFRPAPVKDDELVMVRVARSGKFTGVPTLVMPRLQMMYRGEFDVPRKTGAVILISGDAIQDVVTFDVSPDGARGSRQRTRGTTWYGFPAISPDGRALYYMRGDAVGDNLYRLSIGADTAIEVALSSTRGAANFVTGMSADGRLVSFKKASELSVLDVATQRIVVRPASSNDRGFPLGPYSTLERLPGGGGLVVLDSVGRVVGELKAPDSVTIMRHSASPDETQVVMLMSIRGQSVLGVSPVDRWDPRVLSAFGTLINATHLSWSTDGSIYFARWIPGGDGATLWRQSVQGGPPTLAMRLPARCAIESVAVATAAPMGMCLMQDFRSDVFLANVPGVTR
jgi:tRNA A-37 threonylcarbamoyl transferase component Bud32/Tol biopolymer transport system component